MHLRLVFLRQQHGSDETFKFEPQSYLRMDGDMPKGPAKFAWSEEQLDDLATLFRASGEEGPRQRLGVAQARFLDGLSLSLPGETFDDADERGAEITVSVSSAASELYALPWEITAVGNEGMYLSDYPSVLVRYTVPGLEPPAPSKEATDPSVLLAWSAAGGAVPLKEHAASLRDAAARGGIAHDALGPVTEAKLRDALEEKTPTVLHLLCHGTPPAGPGEPPALVWGDDEGGRTTVTAARLARILRPHRKQIRMVLLCVCGGGDGRVDSMFISGLAQDLHKKGINNVVASRYLLSASGSCVLVDALYDKLLAEGWSLERALRHARSSLFLPDHKGKIHRGDAYGLQLYAHTIERFVSDNGVIAERPVLSTYPFGKPGKPAPLAKPPRNRVRLELKTPLQEILPNVGKLLSKLRTLAEDPSMNLLSITSGSTMLYLDITIDGAQRLHEAFSSGLLEEQLGYELGDMRRYTEAVPPSIQTPSAPWLGTSPDDDPANAPQTVSSPGSEPEPADEEEEEPSYGHKTLPSNDQVPGAKAFDTTLTSSRSEVNKMIADSQPTPAPVEADDTSEEMPAPAVRRRRKRDKTSPWAKPRKKSNAGKWALAVLVVLGTGVVLKLAKLPPFGDAETNPPPIASTTPVEPSSSANAPAPSLTAASNTAASSSPKPPQCTPAPGDSGCTKCVKIHCCQYQPQSAKAQCITNKCKDACKSVPATAPPTTAEPSVPDTTQDSREPPTPPLPELPSPPPGVDPGAAPPDLPGAAPPNLPGAAPPDPPGAEPAKAPPGPAKAPPGPQPTNRDPYPE